MNRNKNSYNYIFLVFIILFFTSGCRYEVGTDYFSYKELYEDTYPIDRAIEYSLFSNERNAEVGYMLLSSIFRFFKLEINFMYLFISLFTTIIILKSILKYNKKYLYLSIITYYTFIYFVIDLSAVRQSISLSIFLYSVSYIYNQNYKKYICSIIIASLFHTSALFLLPFYWLLKCKYTDKFIYILIFISFIICLLQIQILSYITENIGTKLGGVISFKLNAYLFDYQKVWGMNLKVILQIGILFIILKKRHILQLNNTYFNIFLNLYFYYLIIRLIFWESIDINSRLGYYFLIGLIFILPLLLECFNHKLRKWCLIFILSFNFYQGHTYFLENISTITYNPYQNFYLHKILNKKDTGIERWNKHKVINE